jgi:hypothetical protein
MSLILRSVKGSKLTIEETDSNFTYLEELAQSGGGVFELTYAQALELLDIGGVVDGTRYLITGFDVELYGGTTILVNGLQDNQLSQNGWGEFYNPRYDSISVWYSGLTYSIDDLVIYGGKVWKNLTGSVGYVDTPPFILNGDDWQVQNDYENIDYYIRAWDKIEIGYADGNYCINSRYDSFRNNYVRVGQLDSYDSDRWFYCDVNPIAAFGWGNSNINDCTIKDSYFNCLNVINTQIYGVKMSNYSYLFDTKFKDSTIESLSFTNESGAYSLTLDNTYLSSSRLSNSSYINGEFYNSTVQYLDLSNSSHADGTFYNSTL